ncbi:protein kinase [Aureococcus anophagefferens]|uniref:Protein kinase n=1 Tax=Aureococcus anophagefferens TaxID=44056 RepID=A0ABR1G8N9_AURAN
MPEAGGWTHIGEESIELGDQIGGGGVALVYKGWWGDDPVAIKTLFDPKVDAKLKQEYMDELLVMSELKHRNVRKPPIVHRDLKTHNVLQASNGVLKICDFGLVRTKNSGAGTPSYMAPELFTGKPFNASVGVTRSGVLLCELFSGEQPFMATTTWTCGARLERALRQGRDGPQRGPGGVGGRGRGRVARGGRARLDGLDDGLLNEGLGSARRTPGAEAPARRESAAPKPRPAAAAPEPTASPAADVADPTTVDAAAPTPSVAFAVAGAKDVKAPADSPPPPAARRRAVARRRVVVVADLFEERARPLEGFGRRAPPGRA